MRKKFNKYMTTGLLFNGAFLMTREIDAIPEIIKKLVENNIKIYLQFKDMVL